MMNAGKHLMIAMEIGTCHHKVGQGKLLGHDVHQQFRVHWLIGQSQQLSVR